MSSGLAKHLLGSWTTDPDDHAALDTYGRVTMVFRPDGTLVYTIEDGEDVQAINLTWRLEDGDLVTDQPSSPHAERSSVSLSPDDRLLLVYEGQASRYVRKNA